MPFKKGDRVHCRKLEETGVVLEVLRNGNYKVAIGVLNLECRENELRKLERWEKEEAGPKPSTSKRRAKGTPARSRSVDLHGMRVEEALALVETVLDEALRGNADSVEIVHGVGTGRLKAAVHRYLRGLAVVKRYRVDEKNPGATWVYF